MRRSIPRRAVRAILALLLASGCVRDPWVRTLDEERGTVAVYREREVVDGKLVDPGWDHPREFDEDTVRRILESLFVLEPFPFSADRIAPVFSDEEVDRLSPLLVAAFGKASSFERLRFFTYQPGLLGLFAARDRTEGVLFVEPGDRLNVAFAAVREAIDPRSEEIVGGEDPCRVTVSRVRLLPPEGFGTQRRRGWNDEYPLWVVVDLKGVHTEATSPPLPLEGERREAR
jgi:hypothetical protein